MRRGIASLLAAVGIVGAGVGTAPAQAPLPAPNILVIVTDDQRAEGSMDVLPQTAELFGSGGVSFSDAYATTPLCCPSRASIMTGLYAHNHRVLANNAEHVNALDHRFTVQRYLQDAGYRTAIFGKLFNGWDMDRTPPYFDEWAINRGGYKNVKWNVQGEVVTLPTYSTHYVQEKSLDFINRMVSEESPWMLYVLPFAPHNPAKAAREFEFASIPAFEPNPATSEPEDDSDGVQDKPQTVQQNAIMTMELAEIEHDKQLRALMSVDALVGELFDVLARTGEADNTLAVFTSDNGYLWGEHGLRGKGVPYLPSVQVPLYLRWPAIVPGGTTDDRIAANIDIAPTILDAAGILPEVVMDGDSLLDPGTRDHLLLEVFDRNEPGRFYWGSITSKKFQYTEWYLEESQTVPEFVEFYDLPLDPWQLHNTVTQPGASQSTEYGRLATQLRIDRSCSGESCP